jgi:hypothetical protein
MSLTPERAERWPADDFIPTEELVRRQCIQPIMTVDDLAQPDPWESEEEHQEFLADLYASRRSGIS